MSFNINFIVEMCPLKCVLLSILPFLSTRREPLSDYKSVAHNSFVIEKKGIRFPFLRSACTNTETQTRIYSHAGLSTDGRCTKSNRVTQSQGINECAWTLNRTSDFAQTIYRMLFIKLSVTDIMVTSFNDGWLPLAGDGQKENRLMWNYPSLPFIDIEIAATALPFQSISISLKWKFSICKHYQMIVKRL